MTDRVLATPRPARTAPRWRSALRIAGLPTVHAPVGLAIVLVVYAVTGPGSYVASTTMTVLIYAIAALGLNVPAGFGGVLTLGQGAAFAIGAYTVGALTVAESWPYWASLPAAAVVGCVFGLLLGIPAGRLGEIGLALISVGAVLILGDMIIALDGVTGGTTGLSPIGVISTFGGEASTWLWALPILVSIAAVVAYLAQYWVRITFLGRSAIAVRDEPIGATALGMSVYWTKVLVFSVGGAFGAVAGGLFGMMQIYISPDAFTTTLTLTLLAIVVLGGSGSFLGPVIGAVILIVVPQELAEYPHVNNLIFGGILILIIVLRPSGMIRSSSVRVRDSLAAAAPDGDATAVVAADAPLPAAAPEPTLVVDGASRSFGGVKALDDVSLSVRGGEVLALIGPNGSGKTTLVNLVTGMYRPDAGTILLGDVDITGRRARHITELGVARTFQTPKTFPGLSVAEHLLLAKRLQRSDRASALENPDPMVRRLLLLGGIDADDPEMMSRQVRDFGHGQLRFLEIAMAIRHAPRVLLLDEPAAGLSQSEMEGLEAVVRDLADLGVAVVIVEHHVDLVLRLADRVTVLELGRVLWEGRPDELMHAEAVKTAYLGASVS